MAAWNKEFALVLQASWERKEVKRRNGVMREQRKQCVSLNVRGIMFAVCSKSHVCRLRK